jgi:hypothetical protein
MRRRTQSRPRALRQVSDEVAAHQPPLCHRGTKPLGEERRENRLHSLLKQRERLPCTLEVQTGDGEVVANRRREAPFNSRHMPVELPQPTPPPPRSRHEAAEGRSRRTKYPPQPPDKGAVDGLKLHSPLASTAGREGKQTKPSAPHHPPSPPWPAEDEDGASPPLKKPGPRPFIWRRRRKKRPPSSAPTAETPRRAAPLQPDPRSRPAN